MAVIMCPFQPFLILISTPLLLSHALLLHLHYEMHLVQSHLEEAEKPTDSTSRLILVGPGRHNTRISFFPRVWPMSHCGSVLT